MYTYVKGKGWVPVKPFMIDGKRYLVELRHPDPDKGELGCYTGAASSVEWWEEWFAIPGNIEYMRRNIYDWLETCRIYNWASLIPLE